MLLPRDTYSPFTLTSGVKERQLRCLPVWYFRKMGGWGRKPHPQSKAVNPCNDPPKNWDSKLFRNQTRGQRKSPNICTISGFQPGQDQGRIFPASWPRARIWSSFRNGLHHFYVLPAIVSACTHSTISFMKHGCRHSYLSCSWFKVLSSAWILSLDGNSTFPWKWCVDANYSCHD